MPPVSPEHLARRRRGILDAAARCFARNGFHATSMPDICAEAKMSAGGVYRYFTGKDELIRELADTATEPVLHALREAVALTPVPGPAHIIDLIHRTLLDNAAGSPGTSLVLQVWAEIVRNPAVRASQHLHGAQLLAVLERFVTTWQPNNPDSPADAARALMAISMGIFVTQNVLETSDATTSTAALLDVLTNLLTATSTAEQTSPVR